MENPRAEQGNTLTTSIDVAFGAPITDINRVYSFSPDEYEKFIRAWIEHHLKGQYTSVHHFGSSGDKGRDIVGYFDQLNQVWDNFQCKHYNAPLAPSDIWIELGKIVYYSYIGDYSWPSKYYFVPSKDVGGTLVDLLNNPEQLKKELIAKWNQHCENKITRKTQVILDTQLKQYIEACDFSIFTYKEITTVIEEIKGSAYYLKIFGGGLRLPLLQALNENDLPDLSEKELVYSTELFKVYSESLGNSVTTESELPQDLLEHFKRQRILFYTADYVEKVERENLGTTEKAFEAIKDEIHSGIVEMLEDEYRNGLDKVRKVITYSGTLPLSPLNPLISIMGVKHKQGTCHHLVNDKKFTWIKDHE